VVLVVLMPCRALGAFGLISSMVSSPEATMPVLMPCRALGAFGLSLSDLGIALPTYGS